MAAGTMKRRRIDVWKFFHCCMVTLLMLHQTPPKDEGAGVCDVPSALLLMCPAPFSCNLAARPSSVVMNEAAETTNAMSKSAGMES
jgi:hypothetical protein